ncbi:M15 family metallopeptidase [Streptomyces sp. R08]|uniref:M15 family metallopeptidase n=1 Tax=Streptomyces sp. R08 TaxID=3238624 RepID=A0AB39MFB9_9ACTN
MQGITDAETENRHHLHSFMDSSGFSAYGNERWRYALKAEPYPDTYVDFPVT